MEGGAVCFVLMSDETLSRNITLYLLTSLSINNYVVLSCLSNVCYLFGSFLLPSFLSFYFIQFPVLNDKTARCSVVGIYLVSDCVVCIYVD